MNTKLLAASLLSAATLIGCADKIEVPDDTANSTRLDKRIVYNRIEPGNDESGFIDILDSNGAFVRNIGRGLVAGTGKNKILYAVQLPEPAQRGAADIYVTDADGSNTRKLATVSAPGQDLYGFPVISLDGSMVAYATRDSIDENTTDRVLHAIRTDGTGHVILSRELDYETGMGLSPDGRRVVYYSGPPTGTGANATMMIANTDGTGSTPLVTGIATGHDFTMGVEWSHDGRKIAYGSGEGWNGFKVNVINPDGSNNMQVGSGYYPTWSPDDAALAWTSNLPDHTYDIVVTRDMGLTLERLTSTSESETYAQFSPDGSKILCLVRVDDDELGGTLELIDASTHATTVRSNSSFTGYWLR